MKFKFLSIATLIVGSLFAQEADTTEVKEEGYIFTDVITIPHTSVKDQNRSGTCWSYSAVSFIESESMKLGKDSIDLSEMFLVRHNYAYKAERYVRMHGYLNYAQGGSFYDVLWAYDKFGALTQEQYNGIEYGEEAPVFGELDAVLTGYIKAVALNKNKKLSPVWKDGFEAILDTYMGEIPETVSVNGKDMTPKEQADELVGIDVDDYVSITSYTHHPFYSTFALEIQDNWQWSPSYNVPLDEMMEIFDYALDNGYSIAWGGDVSEKGFSHHKGLAITPETDIKEMADSERSKWGSKKASDFYNFKEITPEKEITQDLRQEGYDNWTTTDDHGMHIVGKATDQEGNEYYKTKNSWNTDNSKYEGFLYMSKPFVAYKTMNIVVNKNAVPKSILKKLGL